SLESQAVILLARADGAGDLRCDHASDGRPVIDVTEEVKLSRAPHGCADYCMGRSRPRQNSEDANSGHPAGWMRCSKGQKSALAGDHWPDIFPSPLRGAWTAICFDNCRPLFSRGARGPAEEMTGPNQVGLTFFNSPFSLCYCPKSCP